MNEADAGSTPVDPPNVNGAVAERRMHFAVDEDDDGSSPFGPAKFFINQRRKINVCTQKLSRYRDVNFQLFLVR